MIVRYTQATKALANTPVRSNAVVGKDKQQLIFDITLTNQIAKNTNQNILHWEGSGKIEAIQSVWLTTQAGLAQPLIGYTFTIANNMVNIALDNEDATTAIPANAKLTLTLIVGQKTVG